MLAYLPSVDLNMFGISDFSKEYIHKHVYLSALRKLELYLNKMCKNGVSEQINEYTKFCIKLYSENALFDMTPEKLIGAKFCLPEREIRDQFPIQWEENLLQETTAEVGITDEVELETRPKSAKKGPPIRWEENLLEKEFKDTEVGVIDERKTEPGLRIRNGSSSLRVENPQENEVEDTEVGVVDKSKT